MSEQGGRLSHALMKTALVLPATLAVLLLVSCETPPPHPSQPLLRPVSQPAVTAPAPAVHPYPHIAGVWQGPYATITIARGTGPSFAMSMKRRGGKIHASTGHWGQPFHRHFTFLRADGRTAKATVDSLNPATISVEEEDGRIRPWTLISPL